MEDWLFPPGKLAALATAKLLELWRLGFVSESETAIGFPSGCFRFWPLALVVVLLTVVAALVVFPRAVRSVLGYLRRPLLQMQTRRLSCAARL